MRVVTGLVFATLLTTMTRLVDPSIAYGQPPLGLESTYVSTEKFPNVRLYLNAFDGSGRPQEIRPQDLTITDGGQTIDPAAMAVRPADTGVAMILLVDNSQ